MTFWQRIRAFFRRSDYPEKGQSPLLSVLLNSRAKWEWRAIPNGCLRTKAYGDLVLIKAECFDGDVSKPFVRAWNVEGTCFDITGDPLIFVKFISEAKLTCDCIS